MLCVNKLGLNWALRTQGSAGGPTRAACRASQGLFPPRKLPPWKSLEEMRDWKRSLPVWMCGRVDPCVACFCRGRVWRWVSLHFSAPTERGERRRTLGKCSEGVEKKPRSLQRGVPRAGARDVRPLP